MSLLVDSTASILLHPEQDTMNTSTIVLGENGLIDHNEIDWYIPGVVFASDELEDDEYEEEEGEEDDDEYEYEYEVEEGEE